MAGDSVLVPGGAVMDDAGEAMLVMPLSLPCVVMTAARQYRVSPPKSVVIMGSSHDLYKTAR
jgi:hypothetical protein